MINLNDMRAWLDVQAKQPEESHGLALRREPSPEHQSEPPVTTPKQAEMPPITVVDALMGAGKTTLAIKLMTDIADSVENMFEDGAHRFLYITPFLPEVARIKAALVGHAGDRIAYDPQRKDGSKLNHLNEMILEGKNIVSTHSLFSHVNGDTCTALDSYQYTLMIDEVADWVEQYPMSSKDLRMLYALGILKVDPATRRVVWTDPEPEAGEEPGYHGKFDDLRSLCMQGKLVASRLGKKGEPSLLLWQFPVDLLSRFKEVYIFTHLFDGSDMANYLRLHGVPVKMATIGREVGTLVDYDEDIERERLEKVRHLITVVSDPKLNAVGAKKGRANPLSVSWFETDRRSGGHQIARLKQATYTFFRHRAGTPSSANLWSTFKSHRSAVAGKGYSRAFIPCKSRATNEYRDRSSLAYLVNLYHHPYIRGYFEDAGVKINADYYALLTMAQWVWRSQIREGRPITVYIPSERMRSIFLNWLNGRLPVVPLEPRLVVEPDDLELVEAEAAQAADEAIAKARQTEADWEPFA